MHSVTLYTKVSQKLADWLKARGVDESEWLKFYLRESAINFAGLLDELQEAATLADVYSAPIFDVERYGFEDIDKLDLFVERRRLVPAGKPKHFATNELIGRVMSKWFEMQEKENAIVPSSSPSIS